MQYYSADGRLLSGIESEDSRLCRDAYAGALCVADEKYRLEVQYCSFSRSNELRFLVGDIVKYAENKLRAHLGIKSRMSVYSVPTELTKRLDEYFLRELPKRILQPHKEREKQAYEALYDLPRKPLSLADAKRIESESWDTTRELVDAFEETAPAQIEPIPISIPTPISEETPVPQKAAREDGWQGMLGELFPVLVQTAEGDANAIRRYARGQGKLADAIADEINEVVWEKMGDAVIEERDGGFFIIEEYCEELMQQLREEDKG